MQIPRPTFDLKEQMGQTFASSHTGPLPYPARADELVERELEAGSRYEHVFRLVSEAAWAIKPEVLLVIKDVLTYRMAGHRLEAWEIDERIGAGSPEREAARRGAAPARRGAVALLSLYGMIAPRASMVSNVSGPSGTGLDAFTRQLEDALDSPDVASIVVDVNSPGGMVDMVPETAARIREARDRKPIYGVANTDAGSAAYWLLSQMSEVAQTPSGMVGSIGVYSMHQDMSGALELQGLRNTLVSAGKYKVEGNPFESLGEEARQNIQAMVDGYYDWFVDDVAKGRGVKTSVVRSGYGEGRMLMSKQALAEGMVDRIDTLEGVVRRALNGGGRSRGAAASSAEGVTVPTDHAEIDNAVVEAAEEIAVEHFPYL